MSVTVEQLRTNLAVANQIRLDRADLHHVIAAMSQRGGAQHVARLLLDPPDSLHNLAVRKLLLWINRWGDSRAEGLLAELEIGQRRDVTVGELTERQRVLLSDALTGARP